MHHTAKAILDNDIDMIQSGFSNTPPINFQGDVDADLSLAMPAASSVAIGLLLELSAQVNPASLHGLTKRGDTAVVQVSIDSGWDINSIPSGLGAVL
jgi:hypothetical protein